MNNNDIELMAKSLGLDPQIFTKEQDFEGVEKVVVFINGRGYTKFDPINDWADTGLVLEALFEKGVFVKIETVGGVFVIWSMGSPEPIGKGENLQAAICQAYLTLIKDGE